MLRLRGFLFFVAVLTVLGMAGAPTAPQIEIDGLHANLSEMFLGAGSVFMSIHNTGGRDVLLSASVGVPGAVTELHDVKGSRMIKVNEVVIPSRGTVEMKPASMHVMVFNMPRTIREGSEVSLKLLFERSGEKEVRVRFEKSGER